MKGNAYANAPCFDATSRTLLHFNASHWPQRGYGIHVTNCCQFAENTSHCTGGHFSTKVQLHLSLNLLTSLILSSQPLQIFQLCDSNQSMKYQPSVPGQPSCPHMHTLMEPHPTFATPASGQGVVMRTPGGLPTVRFGRCGEAHATAWRRRGHAFVSSHLFAFSQGLLWGPR